MHIEAGFHNPDFTVREVCSMVGQRMPGLIVGPEDLNDHDEFRNGPVPGCQESRCKDCWRARAR